jgi:predicted nucleic acid-binding protein
LILVDTSIWIDHLRADNSALKRLLDAGRVLMHPLSLANSRWAGWASAK